MRLHGADHHFTLKMTVQTGTEKMKCSTRITIPSVQWGMDTPSTFILRVSDKVDIEIQAGGKLTPAPQL